MSANRSVHIAASYGVSMTEFREDIDKPSVVDGGGEPPQNGGYPIFVIETGS